MLITLLHFRIFNSISPLRNLLKDNSMIKFENKNDLAYSSYKKKSYDTVKTVTEIKGVLFHQQKITN